MRTPGHGCIDKTENSSDRILIEEFFARCLISHRFFRKPLSFFCSSPAQETHRGQSQPPHRLPGAAATLRLAGMGIHKAAAPTWNANCTRFGHPLLCKRQHLHGYGQRSAGQTQLQVGLAQVVQLPHAAAAAAWKTQSKGGAPSPEREGRTNFNATQRPTTLAGAELSEAAAT